MALEQVGGHAAVEMVVVYDEDAVLCRAGPSRASWKDGKGLF
jgi:hypothetical protein